jgi:hypothetical protein
VCGGGSSGYGGCGCGSVLCSYGGGEGDYDCDVNGVCGCGVSSCGCGASGFGFGRFDGYVVDGFVCFACSLLTSNLILYVVRILLICLCSNNYTKRN